MKYHKDHLVIHKQDSLNANLMTHYLVNTYYDYIQTYYFITKQEAEAWVEMEKKLDNLYKEWYWSMITDQTSVARIIHNEGNLLIEKYQTQKGAKSATLSQ